MTSHVVLDEETLAAAAWVCYVHSLDGRTSLKATDTPNWTSEFQKEKYLRRARQIFLAVSLHQISSEMDDPDRIITSADVNNASASKAYELWGGGK